MSSKDSKQLNKSGIIKKGVRNFLSKGKEEKQSSEKNTLSTSPTNSPIFALSSEFSKEKIISFRIYAATLAGFLPDDFDFKKYNFLLWTHHLILEIIIFKAHTNHFSQIDQIVTVTLQFNTSNSKKKRRNQTPLTELSKLWTDYVSKYDVTVRIWDNNNTFNYSITITNKYSFLHHERKNNDNSN